MSHRTVLLLSFFVAAAAAFSFAPSAAAAEWPQCERAKLKLLKLEKTRREANSGGRAKRRRDSARSAAELDEWLWKNCREFSYELRTLEQSRM